MVTDFDSKISIASDVLIRQVGDESVLLDLKAERYLGLDESGTRIWQVLLESDSVKAAYDTLLQEFDVDAEQLRNDLGAFVQELADLGLVQVGATA